MIKYSVIIPHYNAPDLLVRCLKSIPISEEIQVIVVDDCSPGADTYMDIYPEFSRPYLEFYSTGTNGGGGKARNVGLKYAKGTWVLLADSDDFFVDNLCEILDTYYHSNADIIYFRVRSCYEGAEKYEIEGHKDSLYKAYQNIKDERIFRYCYTEPWGKLYRRELIERNNVKFEEVQVANDFLFSVKAGFYAQNIEISDVYLYWYVLMRESTSRGTISQQKKEARIKENIKVQRFLEEHNVRSEYNLLSYVSRLKNFWPILTKSELKVLHHMKYPILPVVKDRIRLFVAKLLDPQLPLTPILRKFL